MGSCLSLLSEVSHDHATLTTSTLTEEIKNDLDFEQSLLKIAQIKIDVSKPLGKITQNSHRGSKSVRSKPKVSSIEDKSQFDRRVNDYENYSFASV